MNPDALKLLKDFGQKKHRQSSFQIDDFTIVLRTLTAQEETEVYKELEGLKGVEFLNRHKVESLARSIIQINDFKWDDKDLAISDDSDNKKLTEKQVKEAINKRRKEMIAEKTAVIDDVWPSNVIDDLYTKYASLMGPKEATDEEIDKAKELLELEPKKRRKRRTTKAD